MNLVGKIFVVLIFFASVTFMTMGMMVYATHRNWQDEVTRTGDNPGYRKVLGNDKAKLLELQAEKDRLMTALATEKKAHMEMLAKVENQRQVLADSNTKLVADKDAVSKQLDAAVADLMQAQDARVALRDENGKLREDLRLANKATADQFKNATALEDKLNIALGQLADLKTRNEQLATLVARAKLLAQQFNVSLENFDQRPPSMRGQVLAVDQDNRVEISLGSDDGLRSGNMLEVFRDSKYLGRMQVLETHPHRAVGKILKEYQQDVIHTGDEVATRFKA